MSDRTEKAGAAAACKWAAYDVLFAAAFPFMLPGFLARMLRRGGYAARMGDRFAIYPPEIRDAFLAHRGEFAWIHAVSVGEVQVASQFMKEWRKADPGIRFCISTTSSTGWKTAQNAAGENDIVIYNPLDFPNFVKSALSLVKPKAIILTESEIWPVFIRRAKSCGIPLFLANARVSDRSAPRYAKAKFLFKDVFRCFTRIFAQSAEDKRRLVAAGAPEETIEACGSFKFDAASRNDAKEAAMREWIGGGKILLGGSTWPGEDAILADVFSRRAPEGWKLAIAPRHFEKADAVEANLAARGFKCIRRSRGDKPPAPGEKAAWLADTTGELMGLYGIADAVFVGKSLCAHGSQNMIEPCLCGKPVATGPNTENFRPVMDDLLEAGAIVRVKDAAELEDVLSKWMAEGDGGLGARASAAVEARKGIVPRCVAAVMEAIG